MFRFISHIMKLNFEPCKGCEVLKQQLELSNSQNKELTDTLLQLIRPRVVEHPTVEVQSTQVVAGTWTRKKAMLEEQERVKARIARESPFIAKSDIIRNHPTKSEKAEVTPLGNNSTNESIDRLEKELNVSEGES